MRIALILQGTTPMLQYWPDFRQKYVEPILRAIDRDQVQCELCLIVFHSSDEFSDGLVENSDWLTSVGEMRALLDALQFVGGGPGDAPLSEAFGRLIYMHSCPSSLDPPAANALTAPGAPGSQAPHRAPCQALLASITDPNRLHVTLPIKNPVKRHKSAHMTDYLDMAVLFKDLNIHLSVLAVKDKAFYAQMFLYNVLGTLEKS